MIGARCALRRLTVCQLTPESRGNGGGLRRGCGFASGRLLGATGPRMESYNWKAKPISPCLGAHEAHPALNRLMMQTESLSDRKNEGFSRYASSICARSTRRFAPRAGNSCQLFNILIGHRQFDCLLPPCHPATPRSIRYKRGIHEGVAGSKTARFMESVV